MLIRNITGFHPRGKKSIPLKGQRAEYIEKVNNKTSMCEEPKKLTMGNLGMKQKASEAP